MSDRIGTIKAFIRSNLFTIYPWATLGIILTFIVFHAFYELQFPKLIPSSGSGFSVARGENLRSVATRLEREGIVDSSFYLALYMRLKGYQVKPGDYLFEGSLSAAQVADRLNRGGTLVSLVIAEGATARDVEQLLAAQGVLVDFTKLTLGDFPEISLSSAFDDAPLEGFLFPDTYEFSGDESADAVARVLLKNFKRKALAKFGASSDPYRALIIASILEKEVKTPEEKAVVAGIIEKRLAANIALQVDATVVYAKCKGTYVTCEDRVLSKKDLAINSPYNTYAAPGLPPTPIGNPGLASIEAAMNPTASKYLYYFTTPEGKTVFSTTLDGHVDGVNKYLRK